MDRRRLTLLLAVLALAPLPALAQQQPIFGCRAAVSCRPSPIGNSALAGGNDGSGGMLLGSSVSWGESLRFGLVTPLIKIPAPEPVSANLFAFHLRDVSLLPPPPPATSPAPPPAAADPKKD